MGAVVSDNVTMPAVTYRLALSGLKQYALVLHAMVESAKSADVKATITKARDDTMALIRLVEEHAKP